jgi:hypothetical protein
MGSQFSKFQDIIIESRRKHHNHQFSYIVIPSEIIYALDVCKYIFPLAVCTYHAIYDNWNNSYISRIYQHDKYGIVITFSLQMAYRMYDFMTDYDGIGNSTPENESKDRRIINRAMFLIAVLRVLFFNWIFKNNTSKDLKTHQKAHLVAICGYIALTFPWIYIYKHQRRAKSDKYYIIKRITCAVFFFGIYQVAGLLCDEIAKPQDQISGVFRKAIQKLPILSLVRGNEYIIKILNIITATMGAIGIAETL